MDRREKIHPDSGSLSGQPVARGTRLSVDFLLDLLASGWSEEQLLDSYPNLKRDSLRAVYAFAAQPARGERAFQPRR
ncbi:MAG TPA: DUF433 domain-containing protein [Rubrobacteraceae bacterium]|nr:DUF433 domain-containing protein [Rubrobacteraceae bacterium]